MFLDVHLSFYNFLSYSSWGLHQWFILLFFSTLTHWLARSTSRKPSPEPSSLCCGFSHGNISRATSRSWSATLRPPVTRRVVTTNTQWRNPWKNWTRMTRMWPLINNAAQHRLAVMTCPWLEGIPLLNLKKIRNPFFSLAIPNFLVLTHIGCENSAKTCKQAASHEPPAAGQEHSIPKCFQFCLQNGKWPKCTWKSKN